MPITARVVLRHAARGALAVVLILLLAVGVLAFTAIMSMAPRRGHRNRAPHGLEPPVRQRYRERPRCTLRVRAA